MTHKLAGIITENLCKNHLITKNDAEIYQYGFEILLDTVMETLLLICAGVFLKKILQTICFILLFSIIRRYSGGFHANTKVKCTMTTCGVYFTNIGICSINFSYSKFYYILLTVLSAIIIWKLAPAEHHNKQLSLDLYKACKMKTRILTIFYLGAVLIFNVYNPEYSRIIGMTLFQVALLIIIQRRQNEEQKKFGIYQENWAESYNRDS